MKFPRIFTLSPLIALLALISRAAPLITVPPAEHPGAGQVFYFVLTDRFANGDTANDTGGIAGGREEHGFDPAAIGYYNGGDFSGLAARLDYIKNLGATAVWVTPPFRNKPVQAGSAGYHGYWILDFLRIDPHLGTDAEFREFVKQARARGLRVFLDIVVNHTADVIDYEGGVRIYRDKSNWPCRDADGKPFDPSAIAFNGIGKPDAFPALDPSRSFACKPLVRDVDKNAKNPSWLNDVTLYHNRGDSAFKGESSLDGDFATLDDVFTEHPSAVQGFIDIYRHWIENYDIDGFRIDTVRHVNLEFWQAFMPAMHEAAAKAGRPHFLAFGEVATYTEGAQKLSEFPRLAQIDSTLDFAFAVAARDYVSRGNSAAALAAFFDTDDYYTDHARNVRAQTTFLGNHDDGRFGLFLKTDNPDANDAQLLDLMKLGHGLLFLARGQPVVYYGDEQGMTGCGNDMRAREPMFASPAKTYRDLPLIGSTRTGADDKFDETHPLYKTIRALAALRAPHAGTPGGEHPAFARGAMIVRPAGHPNFFAFSRIERRQLVEYVIALNNSRTETITAVLPTSQPGGAMLKNIFDSRTPEKPGAPALTADAGGRVTLTLAPLQFAVWQARAPLPSPAPGELSIRFARPADAALLYFTTTEWDGLQFPSRHELRAGVTGGDGFAEVTFAMQRASRPGQYEILGTDDAPPYRIHWSPPADLAPGETLAFIATVDDLRGQRAATRIGNIRVDASRARTGIKNSATPVFKKQPPRSLALNTGERLALTAAAEGTGPRSFQWMRDGEPLAGATDATLGIDRVSAGMAGRYRVLVRGLAGSTLSEECVVTVEPLALP